MTQEENEDHKESRQLKYSSYVEIKKGDVDLFCKIIASIAMNTKFKTKDELFEEFLKK